jgi:hypothetical protein
VIIPQKLRERHWKGYFQTMATRYTPATATSS